MSTVYRMSERADDVERNDPLADNSVVRAIRAALHPSSIWRERFAVSAGLSLVAIAGLLYLIFSPTTYIATATILVASAASPNDLRDVIAAKGDADQFRYKLIASQVKAARLRAELSNAETFTYADEEAGPSDAATVKEIVEREQLLFQSRRKSLQDLLLNTEQALNLFNSEVDSLTKQVDFADQQQVSVDTEVADLRGLVDKGLTPVSRLRDLERSSAALASRKVEYESELLGRKQDVVASRQKLTEIQNERRSEILSDLQQAEEDIRTAQSRLSAADSVRSSLLYSRVVDDNAVADQMSVLQSDEIALKVVQAGDLANDDFIYGGRKPKPVALEAGEAPPSKQDLAIRALQKNLEISRIGRGSEIAISFRSSQPERAALVANAVAMIYTNPDSDVVQTGAPTSSSFVTNGRIMQRAVPEPDGPSKVKLIVLIAFLGTALGLFAGFAAAFARAWLSGLRDPASPGRLRPIA